VLAAVIGFWAAGKLRKAAPSTEKSVVDRKEAVISAGYKRCIELKRERRAYHAGLLCRIFLALHQHYVALHNLAMLMLMY
jgi:hypothetical protein